MKCTSCNAELSDGARFCPYCGHPVQAAAEQAPQADAPDAQAAAAAPQSDSLKTVIMQPAQPAAAPQSDPLKTVIMQPAQPADQQAEPAAAPQEPAVDSTKTVILQDFDLNAQTQANAQPQDAAAQNPYAPAQQGQTQPAYGSTAQMPTQISTPQTYGQPQQAQAYGQPVYGAPVPPQGAPVPPQGAPQYQQYQQYQQAPQPVQPQYQQSPGAGGTVAKKSKRLPIIIAIVVAAVLAATLGVCAALGVGPFGGGSGGGAGGSGVYKLDPNGDPIAQLDAIVKDIQGSGSFDGSYEVSMDLDLGSLGAAAGMSKLSYSMKGVYSLENYNPNDLSKLKMHMTMDMDAMGQKVNAVIDYADGKATITADGKTETQSMSTDELEALFQQSGGMAYDSSTISGYIKGSRIEGDTIIIELDSDFINNLLSSSLAGSGLESAEALVDKLEMRAKVGNGSLEESIDMNFDMSYMGASMSADMDILYTMKKK